jgi:hypothetical protein
MAFVRGTIDACSPTACDFLRRGDATKARQSASAKASARLAAVRSSGPIYVSAKRTHFIFEYFSLYYTYLQRLMPFAAAFANGFVLEKRTHFSGVYGGSVCPGDQNEPKFPFAEATTDKTADALVASNGWTGTMRLLQCPGVGARSCERHSYETYRSRDHSCFIVSPGGGTAALGF